MKIDTLEELEETIYTLGDEDFSFEVLSMLQKCVMRAQELKSEKLEFKARFNYLRNLVFLNQPDEEVAYYPWFLKQLDSGAEYLGWYDKMEILWAYKWILGAIPSYAGIPKEKATQILEDFIQRLNQANPGDKLIPYQKMFFYYKMGRMEEAAEAYEEYKNGVKTSMYDDCSACQPNNVINYLMSIHEFDKILKVSEPILEGSVTCHAVPKTTYSKLAYAHMRLGNWEKALEFVINSEKELNLDEPNLDEWGLVYYYYAKKHKFVQGRKVLEKQLPHCFGLRHDIRKLEFYFPLTIFLKALKATGESHIKLNLVSNKIPKDFPALTEQGYELQALIDWMTKQYQHSCNGLDKRNGNTFWSDYINNIEEWYYSVSSN